MTPSLRKVKGKQLSSISLLPQNTPLDLNSYEVIESGSGKQLVNKEYIDNLNTTPDLEDVLQEGNQTSSDIVITDPDKGLVLEAPDGDKWRLTIDNKGRLIATEL